MKTQLTIWLLALTVSVVAVSCGTSYYATAQSGNDPYYDQANQDADAYTDNNYNGTEPEVTFDNFYNDLSPYGTWMDYPAYGRVWICNVPGFRPYYSGGHWAYSNYGWTWASDYSWGWAPFHYGRWAFEAGYGWMWVPGYQWAPAWVSWRSGGSCYGWAPLAPGISVGVGFGGGIPADRWVFVPHQYINRTNINNYYINTSQNTTIINNTTVINNIRKYRNTNYVTGPDRQDAERAIGRPITPMRVTSSMRPGPAVSSGNTLRIYRPVARANNNNTPGNSNNFNNGGNPRINPSMRPGSANSGQNMQPNNQQPVNSGLTPSNRRPINGNNINNNNNMQPQPSRPQGNYNNNNMNNNRVNPQPQQQMQQPQQQRPAQESFRPQPRPDVFRNQQRPIMDQQRPQPQQQMQRPMPQPQQQRPVQQNFRPQPSFRPSAPPPARPMSAPPQRGEGRLRR